MSSDDREAIVTFYVLEGVRQLGDVRLEIAEGESGDGCRPDQSLLDSGLAALGTGQHRCRHPRWSGPRPGYLDVRIDIDRSSRELVDLQLKISAASCRGWGKSTSGNVVTLR